MLNVRETRSVREGCVIRLERNDSRIGWLDRCAMLGLRDFAKLNSIMKCLQNRELEWFGHLERIEECI